MGIEVNFEGKIALVTGASSGLGARFAKILAQAGAQVVLASRRIDRLKELRAEIESEGGAAHVVALDVTDYGSIKSAIAHAETEAGPIDILINNAGATWGAPAEDYPVDAWDKVMNLNIRSIFLISQAVGKRSMIPRKYGRIINIASIAGLAGNAPGTMQTIAYNTSKAAVINFTRTLAGEWGVHGITVNAIAPGFFPSKMTKGILENLGEEKLAKEAPLQRIGDDEDLKGVAMLFASDAGKHITGQTLAVDGGVSAV